MRKLPLTAIIIEDEQPSARRLKRMLQKYDLQILEMLPSVASSVLWFENHPSPDVIFLDIQLSDGLSFEIFEQVQVESFVIFTSAYNQYALKAFELKSVDYLLKPFEEAALARAMNKLYDFKVQAGPSIDPLTIKKLILEAAGIKDSYKKRFSTRIGQRIRSFEVGDIVSFYSESKGSWMRTREGRDYLVDAPLEAIEEQLDPDKFYRVNRKYIINIDYIIEVHQHTNSRLRIILAHYEDADVIVARERVKAFKLWLG